MDSGATGTWDDKRIAVLCVGNELLLDEGAGPAAGRYLASRWDLPVNVDVIDCATMGMAIIADLRSHDYALVLDAVDVPGARPGTVYSFEPDDVAGSGQMASLHEMRFADVLQTADLIGVRCQGHCLGVQAENISPSEFVRALTPRVAAAVPLLAAWAARWLRDQLGLTVRDRAAEEDPRRAGLGAGAAGTAAAGEGTAAGSGEAIAGEKGADSGSGARDFSGAYPGARASAQAHESTIAEENEGGLVDGLGVVHPLVHGLPDTSVMAGYLAAGLAAVGAQVEAATDVGVAGLAAVGAQVESAADAEDVRAAEATAIPQAFSQVRFKLSGCDDAFVDALIARFGLQADPVEGDGRRLGAIVTPEITDYDCDALIGACQEALRTRAGQPEE